MPSFLTTYDLPSAGKDPHGPFLRQAEKQGLLYVYLTGRDNLMRLPNTTLWGEFENKKAAAAAFDRSLMATGQEIGHAVKLEKRVITKISDALFNSDRKKKPEQKWRGKNRFETSRLHQLNDPFFR